MNFEGAYGPREPIGLGLVFVGRLASTCIISQAITEETISKLGSISPANALTMVKMLGDHDALPKPFKCDVMRTINSMVGNTPSTVNVGTEAKNQLFTNSEDFLPEWLWNILQDKDASYHAKLFASRKFLRSLGASNLSESSRQRFAVIFYLSHANKRGEIDMKGYETIYEDLKTHVKPSKKETKMPWWGKIKVFPKTPADLLKDYPDIYNRAYAEGPPVLSRVNYDELEQLCSSLPMRVSHHLLQSKSKMRFLATPMRSLCSREALIAPDDDNLLTGPLL